MTSTRSDPATVSSADPTNAADPGHAPRSAGALAETSRRLVYNAAPVEIALDISRSGHESSVDVDGQLQIDGKYFPSRDVSVNGFGVQLLQGKAAVAQATTDEQGSFAFRAIKPGSYGVRFHTERLGIMLRPVVLSLQSVQPATES